MNDTPKNEQGPIIVPPVPVMIEQLWRSFAQMGQMVTRVGMMVTMNNSQQGDLLHAMLEQTILVRELAEGLNVKLSTNEELRERLKKDRIEFLQGILKDGSLKEDQVAIVQRELDELLTLPVDPSSIASNEELGR